MTMRTDPKFTPEPESKTIRMIPQPWEKQIGEPHDKYRLFCAYRDMLPRSVRKLGKVVGAKTNTLLEYSVKYNWRSRAERWDAELDRRVSDRLTEDIAEMRRRHIDTSLKMQEAATKEVNAHLGKINEAVKEAQDLAAAAARDRGATKEEVEEAIRRAYHEPKLSMRDLLSLIDHATRLERLNRGEPTDHTTTSVHEAERVKEQLANLSTEEKRQMLQLKRKAVLGAVADEDV